MLQAATATAVTILSWCPRICRICRICYAGREW